MSYTRRFALCHDHSRAHATSPGTHLAYHHRLHCRSVDTAPSSYFTLHPARLLCILCGHVLGVANRHALHPQCECAVHLDITKPCFCSRAAILAPRYLAELGRSGTMSSRHASCSCATCRRTYGSCGQHRLIRRSGTANTYSWRTDTSMCELSGHRRQLRRAPHRRVLLPRRTGAPNRPAVCSIGGHCPGTVLAYSMSACTYAWNRLSSCEIWCRRHSTHVSTLQAMV